MNILIIAGPCLIINRQENTKILETAKALKGLATHYRAKLWGGGTMVDKYFGGVGSYGIETMQYVNNNIMPAGTEVHDTYHILQTKGLGFLWVGARNSQNYTLLKNLSFYGNEVYIKRGSSMTINETIGIYDIMKDLHKKPIKIIERGMNTIDRQDDSRWSPDLKGVIRIKQERPDVFNDLIFDCSHSVGKKEYIKDAYNAFKSIGVSNFMFECTLDGKSKTDQGQMLSVKELEVILK